MTLIGKHTRRGFLGAAGIFGAAALATKARAQETLLDQLMEQNQRGQDGGGFDSASRTVRMPKSTLPTLSPATVETTEQAIPSYEAIVARGGWPAIPKEPLRVGRKSAGVVALRQRLTAGSDLDPNAGQGDIYDTYVEQAVRRFQARHGLTVDGRVNEATLAAMNVPAQARLNQLKTNLPRLRAMGSSLPPRFVMCNLPAAQIETIENGVVVTRHTAIVGKPDRASPDINSRIVEVNFNPFWTVPVSIVRKDLIPKMQAEPDYLVKQRIRVYDPKGVEVPPGQINWYSQEAVNYRFRQDPGDFNSMGSIRINFPSPHGVYMHDTPSKNLFGDDFRFHSSGCVRVQNVRDFVTWLLAETPNWSRPEVDQAIKSGERKDARMIKPVPLHWVYVTAWATPDGVVQFRDDIYNRDGLGQVAQRG
ncbi:murein L,D-transpeptidase [Variibacter gotjawalensis]|uniref:Murein L,D-transpeptidase n=2 Tax=Variibacter gotjawalensis TaxID=1333996 RepID=A0A0S3PXB5_9BRAD|nr:murein L,D-transpeptidase YcbB/YkuD [Variibacter gotjawalensis]BAT60577.1 murein L,D-transpeptidase [Variibacter gotjawalensis]